MIIINIVLEGPKASGKSTIAKHFVDLGYEYFHSSSKTDNDYCYHMNLLYGNNRIIDRFSIGEMIYPAYYDRDGKLLINEFEKTMMNENTIYVVLYSSETSILIDRINERDGDFDVSALLYSNNCFMMMAKNLEKYPNVLTYDIAHKQSNQIIEEINNVLRNV